MDIETNFEAAKSFVEKKRRQGKESLSGPGSHLCNVQETIDLIQEAISEYNIKSILDLGCGDWNWFKEIDLKGSTYTGWDADELMIQSNIDNFGTPEINFCVKDIVLEEYPDVEILVIPSEEFVVNIRL